MKSFIIVVAVSLSPHLFSADTPSSPNTVPIQVLHTALCPRSNIWVEGSVSKKLDTDTYVINDTDSSIILFLPTEELAATPLPIGAKILVFGTVDISPLNPTRNELYAEKVIILKTGT
jgi:uncharacterized protein YdeI (BOF family)